MKETLTITLTGEEIDQIIKEHIEQSYSLGKDGFRMNIRDSSSGGFSGPFTPASITNVTAEVTRWGAHKKQGGKRYN